MVEDLSKGLNRHSELHLDPDLRENAIARDRVFQPAFGQVGNAQSHLDGQEVKQGDLFLFFGLYRKVERQGQRWGYIPRAPSQHIIFGWLQVDKMLCVGPKGDRVPPELVRHPHAIPSSIVRKELSRRSKDKQNNTIYIPREKLTFSTLPGSGLFEAPFNPQDSADRRVLSAPGQNKPSRWRLPSFFSSLSNMGEQPKPTGEWWKPMRKGPGQEFVLDVLGRETEVQTWLKKLFETARRTPGPS
jgi:hypothetical protein